MSVQVLAPEFANRHLILTGQERLRIKDVMTMISEIMPWKIELHFDEAQCGAPLRGDSLRVSTPHRPQIGA